MKRMFLLRLIVLIAVTMLAQSLTRGAAARTPADYPLMCRGGGSLVIGIAPGERNIGFVFTRGSKPAGEGLAPGECSWMDRGMYAAEPDRVSQHVEESSDSLKVGGTLAPENRWYEELHSADKYWTFMVSNNGRGQLIATSARPNATMDAPPMTRLPSGIGEIKIPSVASARAVNNETSKIIVLNGPAEPGSAMEVRNDLAIGRNMNVGSEPRSLSTEEKMALLKSAGLEAFSDPPTPFVILTPQLAKVTGKGALAFHYPKLVHQDVDGAVWDMTGSSDRENGWLSVNLNFETPGIYLLTFTVRVTGYVIKPIKPLTMDDPESFVLTAPNGSVQTFSGTRTMDWRHLSAIFEVAKPGSYDFTLEGKSGRVKIWWLHSCDVSMWKK